MNVPQELALSIVKEMKKIISQDINFFNTDSVIIASTDNSRVGQFHGGAKKVIERNRDVIIEYDRQFEGAKKGINIPIYFDKEIIGVIGITGEIEEVEKYGKIIKRMTEILIKEAYLQEQENIDRESKRLYIEEVLFRNWDNEKTLVMRGDLLNIKTDIPRVVLVTNLFDNDNRDTFFTPEINKKAFNTIKNYISYNTQNIVVQSGTNIIMLLNEVDKNIILRIIKNIKSEIKEKVKIKSYYGIGCISNNTRELKRSYIEAKKALEFALAYSKENVIFYNDMDIGLLFHDITKETIESYNQKIFCKMNPDQIREYFNIVSAFIKHNGSITKTAGELFIHKNTLQYRLNKLNTLTGYDPRKLSDMVILYLAFTLYNLKSNR